MSARGASGWGATVLTLLVLGCGRSGYYFGFTPEGTQPGNTPDGSQGLPNCLSNQLLCGLTCVDWLSDNNNCGSCGNVCPGQGLSSCLDGSCTCLKQVCPSPDGGLMCVDTSTDPDAGDCPVFPIPCCGPGFTSCPLPDGGCGYCADTTTDPNNCGGCGLTCGPNQKCTPLGTMGTCVCDTTSDGGADLIQCPSGCVHSLSDPLNCGSCGFQCQSGACSGGTCVASSHCNVDAGMFACMPPACTDVTTDVHNCGSCGNDCTQGGTAPFPGIECFLGACLCNGGQDYICPQDIDPFPTMACVDITMDSNNCGACGLLADGGGPYSDGGLPPSSHICNGVRSVCQNGACFCPNLELYCDPGTWNPTGSGIPNDAGACLNDTSDSLNCGGCGNACDSLYASGAVCQFASCTCIDAGICVTGVSATDPLNPSCDCNGPFGNPNPDCSSSVSVTFLADIYPLLSANTVTDQPTWGQGGVLVGCAVSGCHDSTAAAGLDFTDPDASYQELTSGISTQICNGVNTQVLNPSVICFCQSLVIPTDGADSLLYQLLANTYVCPSPDGGIAAPMPIDDGGGWHPLSACLAAEVRQWIDQGANY